VIENEGMGHGKRIKQGGEQGTGTRVQGLGN
jgi:hypothetical protein